MVTKLTHPSDGFELNRKLLMGELAPEKWVQELVPEKLPLLVKGGKKSNSSTDEKSASSSSSSSAPATSSSTTATTSSPATDTSSKPSKSKNDNNNNNNNDDDDDDDDDDISDILNKPKGGKTKGKSAAAAGGGAGGGAGGAGAGAGGAGSSSGSAGDNDSAAARSSYYFFKSTDPELAKQYLPKKIDPANPPDTQNTPAPQRITNTEAKVTAPSAWNRAGTWEERNVSQLTCDKLRELLEAIQVPAFADGKCSITSWTVTGEANVVLVRGKKRLGYELSANSTFEAEYKGGKYTGKITVPTIDETAGNDGEVDVKVKIETSPPGDSDSNSSALRKAIKKILSAVQNAYQALPRIITQD